MSSETRFCEVGLMLFGATISQHNKRVQRDQLLLSYSECCALLPINWPFKISSTTATHIPSIELPSLKVHDWSISMHVDHALLSHRCGSTALQLGQQLRAECNEVDVTLECLLVRDTSLAVAAAPPHTRSGVDSSWTAASCCSCCLRTVNSLCTYSATISLQWNEVVEAPLLPCAPTQLVAQS